MKHFLSIVLLSFSLSVVAQSHLTFMDIPIDGTLTTFCKALEKQPFRLDTMYSHGARYAGLYMTRAAYVVMETTPKTHTVYDVLVAFPNTKKWALMEAHYTDLKTQLIGIYGEPVEVKEVGDAPVHDSHIQDKLEDAALIRRTRFETEDGFIDLGIDNLHLFAGSSATPYTYILFTDKTNATKNDQEAFDDL